MVEIKCYRSSIIALHFIILYGEGRKFSFTKSTSASSSEFIRWMFVMCPFNALSAIEMCPPFLQPLYPFLCHFCLSLHAFRSFLPAECVVSFLLASSLCFCASSSLLPPSPPSFTVYLPPCPPNSNSVGVSVGISRFLTLLPFLGPTL